MMVMTMSSVIISYNDENETQTFFLSSSWLLVYRVSSYATCFYCKTFRENCCIYVKKTLLFKAIATIENICWRGEIIFKY